MVVRSRIELLSTAYKAVALTTVLTDVVAGTELESVRVTSSDFKSDAFASFANPPN